MQKQIKYSKCQQCFGFKDTSKSTEKLVSLTSLPHGVEHKTQALKLKIKEVGDSTQGIDMKNITELKRLNGYQICSPSRNEMNRVLGQDSALQGYTWAGDNLGE